MNSDVDSRLHWTKAQIFKFINLVRQHPQIWDSQHNHFLNRFQRELAYDAISYQMGVTNEVVKKKIHILRCQYNVEIKKMKKRNTKEPVWPYFKAMRFLYESQERGTNVIDNSLDRIDNYNDDDYESVDKDPTPAKQSRLSENIDAGPFKWSQWKTLKLIELYRKYPELYNSKCFDYRNKYKRNLAFESIAEQIGATIQVIKKKMHTLRTTYVYELKKMKTKNYAQPRWKLFDSLKFLYDEAYYTPRPKYNVPDVNVDSNVDDELENIIEYALECNNDYKVEYLEADDMEDDSISSKTTDQNQASTTQQQEAAASCDSCKVRDEFTIFGETVATELRLTKDHKGIHELLKRKILKAVKEAKELIAVCSD